MKISSVRALAIARSRRVSNSAKVSPSRRSSMAKLSFFVVGRGGDTPKFRDHAHFDLAHFDQFLDVGQVQRIASDLQRHGSRGPLLNSLAVSGHPAVLLG